MRGVGPAAARADVGPEIVHGIEINPLAAELARTTIWIGDIQWRLRNGIYARPEPILRQLDAIECRDALIAATLHLPLEGGGRRAKRRRVGVNAAPSKRLRRAPHPGRLRSLRELRRPTLPLQGRVKRCATSKPNGRRRSSSSAIRRFWASRLMRRRSWRRERQTFSRFMKAAFRREADLVVYWFEKARAALNTKPRNKASDWSPRIQFVAELTAAFSIRSRRSRIFDAWSDEPWVIEGAAVQVSLICFGEIESGQGRLNGVRSELRSIRT